MNKPEDIPQDVWDAARSAVCGFMAMNQTSFHVVSRVARAIMAAEAEQREVCAAVASALQWLPKGHSPNNEMIKRITSDWGGKIAAAIRKGGAA